ncbi:hypothetical protein DFH11DRAFT_1611462 [Phellopilus nigrolimitatus]|nr:hypothetical protein DFH11DRAFT_1611462 [Phellopilus nigrolimitatus]
MVMSTSPAPASPEEVRVDYNKFYNDPDADITLQSSDGVRFKVHSLILRLSSDALASNPADEIVQLSEGGDIIISLLNSIYPRRPRPKLSSLPFSFVSRLVAAADKYDLLDYALASRHGWDSDARSISQFIPPPNTSNPPQRTVLESMGTASLLKLFDLHRRRRDIIIRALSISYDKNAVADIREHHLRWEVISREHAEDCRSQTHDKLAWANLKLFILTEMDRISPDEVFRKLQSEVLNSNRLKDIWEGQCSKCSARFFNNLCRTDVRCIKCCFSQNRIIHARLAFLLGVILKKLCVNL